MIKERLHKLFEGWKERKNSLWKKTENTEFRIQHETGLQEFKIMLPNKYLKNDLKGK